jgi:hypothetical protein
VCGGGGVFGTRISTAMYRKIFMAKKNSTFVHTFPVLIWLEVFFKLSLIRAQRLPFFYTGKKASVTVFNFNMTTPSYKDRSVITDQTFSKSESNA